MSHAERPSHLEQALRGRDLREQMVRQQIVQRGITRKSVIDALLQVPRELFMPRATLESAYTDHAAPIGHDQTISQPYMVALMSDRLNVSPGHRVLEIGTGSGYQTAVLSHLALKVYTTERVKPLLDEAWERLMFLKLRNIQFRHGDGTLGWPGAGPFDRILIAAGAPVLPQTLLFEQLVDTGEAILPVGPMEEQILLHVRRTGDRLERSEVCPCRFVKLIGSEGWPGHG